MPSIFSSNSNALQVPDVATLVKKFDPDLKIIDVSTYE